MLRPELGKIRLHRAHEVLLVLLHPELNRVGEGLHKVGMAGESSEDAPVARHHVHRAQRPAHAAVDLPASAEHRGRDASQYLHGLLELWVDLRLVSREPAHEMYALVRQGEFLPEILVDSLCCEGHEGAREPEQPEIDAREHCQRALVAAAELSALVLDVPAREVLEPECAHHHWDVREMESFELRRDVPHEGVEC